MLERKRGRFFKEACVPSNVFLLFFGANILVMLVALFVSGGSFLGDIVWDGRHAPDGVDFRSHIGLALSRNPYAPDKFYYPSADGAVFSPFSYFIYYIIGRMIPSAIKDSGVSNWDRLYLDILECLNVCVIVLAGRKYVEKRTWVLLALFACIILSHPFSFAVIKAGNSTLWVLSLLLMSLHMRNSENKLYRELSLVFLAMAACLKMTPAVLGLLWLKEKRYKEAFRLVLYGLVLFVPPFFFFGGLPAARNYLTFLHLYSGHLQARPETIPGVCMELADVLGFGLEKGLLFGKALAFLYFAVVLGLVCFTKLNWKSYALLVTLLMILVNHTYPYTMIYLVIPVLLFVRETDLGFRRLDFVYAFLFPLVLAGYPFLKIDWPTATFITNYFWLYITVFVLVADKCSEFIKCRRASTRTLTPR
ncbi:MAG: DUF2029 domain-containing protein [Treponema sp.]|nr:DUF2029 domain-containing protein [Treponema sp.]